MTASLSDPDGSISGLTWQWYDDTVDEDDLTVNASNAIEDANSATYTPDAEDAEDDGKTLTRKWRPTPTGTVPARARWEHALPWRCNCGHPEQCAGVQ